MRDGESESEESVQSARQGKVYIIYIIYYQRLYAFKRIAEDMVIIIILLSMWSNVVNSGRYLYDFDFLFLLHVESSWRRIFVKKSKQNVSESAR